MIYLIIYFNIFKEIIKYNNIMSYCFSNWRDTFFLDQDIRFKKIDFKEYLKRFFEGYKGNYKPYDDFYYYYRTTIKQIKDDYVVNKFIDNAPEPTIWELREHFDLESRLEYVIRKWMLFTFKKSTIRLLIKHLLPKELINIVIHYI